MLLMIWQPRHKIITDVSQEVKHLSNFFNERIHEYRYEENSEIRLPFANVGGGGYLMFHDWWSS